MQQNKSVLEAIYEEETETLEDEDLQDVEMLDAETLEDREPPSQQIRADDSAKDGGNGEDDDKMGKQEPCSKKSRGRKSKNKKTKSGAASSITDVNSHFRFVVDTCRHLKERKSYVVWNAVGVLGTYTLSDLVKEVDAIQNCGGQLTADGKRFRSSGGILWNILKTREPKAYKEIMEKGREFEKEFRQKSTKLNLQGNKEATFKIAAQESSNFTLETQDKPAQCDTHGWVSVLSRIRTPVTYGDLFEENENG